MKITTGFLKANGFHRVRRNDDDVWRKITYTKGDESGSRERSTLIVIDFGTPSRCRIEHTARAGGVADTKEYRGGLRTVAELVMGAVLCGSRMKVNFDYDEEDM